MLKNALEIPELLDLSIQFLIGSTSDLLSCSLVARSWVEPAQQRLFSAPHRTNRKLTATEGVIDADAESIRFDRSMRSNPRLATYVRELRLSVADDHFTPYTQYSTLQRMCAHNFQNLEILQLVLVNPLIEIQQHVSRLLGYPSLRSLTFVVNYYKISRWFVCVPLSRLLEGCSPSIQHIHLVYTLPSGVRIDNLNQTVQANNRTLIRVKSARLDFDNIDSSAVYFPFDLSEMQALAILPWRSIPPTIPTSTVEVLEIEVLNRLPAVDISSFTALKHLRFAILDRVSAGTIIATLATIPPTTSIKHICFQCTLPQLSSSYEMSFGDLAKLDPVLADLPFSTLPTVEVELCGNVGDSRETKMLWLKMVRYWFKATMKRISVRLSWRDPQEISRRWLALVEAI
ncbi:hypothetical protein R3P38DRAFT_3073485 [Favolaschia claudopus]|uniref:F-box domain-containing protein n=1 Tax=Favolaschia claudopus TaxID=2862362 RepID=A0AAV9ZXF5_9AGAR